MRVLCLISRSNYKGFIEVCETQYFIYSFKKKGPTKDVKSDAKIPPVELARVPFLPERENQQKFL